MPGLVICDISVRGALEEASGSLWKPAEGFELPPSTRTNFPSPDLVSAAAGAFSRRLPTWKGEEGPRARIIVSPGSITVARRDLARLARSAERRAKPFDVNPRNRAGVLPQETDQEKTTAGTKATITEWSAKSRSNMVATIAALDLTRFVVTRESLPGMVTLTYPGDWLTVAPDAQTAKAHHRALCQRFARRYGRPMDQLWKFEFQGRSAPHFHIFMLVPSGLHDDGVAFRDWLSQAWADVVAHPDPAERARHLSAGTGVDIPEGLRATDPRRVAVYFSKHSSANFGDKEYQHVVPAEWSKGPGRFWGYRGLDRVTAEVEVPIDDSIRAARIMRRWARAQGTTRQEKVWRSGEGRFRKVRRRVKRMPAVQGFLCVNDGPSFAWQLGRALDAMDMPWQHTMGVPF